MGEMSRETLAPAGNNILGLSDSMTIYKSLLAKGYFPKELPPSFFTEQFAAYATTKKGRSVLEAYKPLDNFTESVRHHLALSGHDKRDLRIPHPSSFSVLARLVSKHFRRLLTKASSSAISRSRPVYDPTRTRAISPNLATSSIVRERIVVRAGASVLLKVDISQFYPSLYTHAIGWAIDPQLRIKANWKSTTFLGKKIDQALMNLQGKLSQGIPIGNDISFLLAEVVLSQVDRAVTVKRERGFRWYDDYELAFDTKEEAERALTQLRNALHSFNLRPNPRKTKIVILPHAVQDGWQVELLDRSKQLTSVPGVIHYFDAAFDLRNQFRDEAVLTYALGLLFQISAPSNDINRVAQSGISQSLLGDSGVTQKALSLISFWCLNGAAFDPPLLSRTLSTLIERHMAKGVTSDVAWALAFAISHKVELSTKAGRVLTTSEDDCIAIQALHAHSLGLIKSGFTTKKLSKLLKNVDLDGEHWLLGYESVRHGFLAASKTAVTSNPLFADLLAHKVSFYRMTVPQYSLVLQSGGAPEWLVTSWLDRLKEVDTLSKMDEPSQEQLFRDLPILRAIAEDILRLELGARTKDEKVANLLNALNSSAFAELIANEEPYA